MKKTRLAIVGTGELAYHIAHYAVEDNKFIVEGFFDDFTPVKTKIHGYPVLGTLNELEHSFSKGRFDELLLAVGYSRMDYRKSVFERFEKKIPMAKLIHSSCFIDPHAKIGTGSVIFPRCTVYKDANIQQNVCIQVGSIITDSTIKNHSLISANVTIAGHCIIGKCCNIGVSTTIINDINICDYVRTGGGTVVTKNISESGLYVGVPARRIGEFK